MNANKTHGEKTRLELHWNTKSYFEQILEVTPYETATVLPLTSHLKSHASKTNKANETNSLVTFFYGPLDIDAPVLADQQGLIYISSLRTQNVDWRIDRKLWMKGTDGD